MTIDSERHSPNVSHEAPLQLRLCCACGRSRPVVLFRPRGNLCQLCRQEKTLAVQFDRRNNRSNKRWLTYKVKDLLHNAQMRSLRYGVACDLSASWVLDKIIAGKCEVTGIHFNLSEERQAGAKSGRRNNFIPSLDRIDPNGGYTKENCRMVVWIYNAAKGTGEDADVMKMARALLARCGQ